MPSLRTPIELIHLYWERVWNEGQTQLIREICADPIIRHEQQGIVRLSHDEQIARVDRATAVNKPYFTHVIVYGDDLHVTSVWNMYMRHGERRELSGIEVFKVEQGRMAETWISSFSKGFWPEVEKPGND